MPNKEIFMKRTILFTALFLSAITFVAMTTTSVSAENGNNGLNSGKGNRFNNREASSSASSSASPRVRNNLRAIVLQAKVDAVSASSLTISKDGKTYTVNIATDTHIRRRFGGKSDLIEYSVGNTVSVWGVFTDANKTTINARQIRNLSIQKRNGVFFGTIKSVGTGTFVLASKNRGDQTISIAATTKLVNRKQTPITASDLKVGDRVRVHGLWDNSRNTVTEVVQVKDFSQPPFASRTPKASSSASASASASPSSSPAGSAE